jgi:hypothetical protein
MSRTHLRPVAYLCRIGLALFVLSSTFLIGSPALSVAQSAPPPSQTSVQSDDAAIQAMKNVIVQSGGVDAWTSLRSAKETFSVSTPGQTTPQVLSLLDDWSLETTRYRRRVQGQAAPPSDHNGAATYTADAGTLRGPVAEFDQARVLAARLPAAAAEVMLRRHEYVLKISKTQGCQSSEICVDVFRASGPGQPVALEQQWKISALRGLPVTIRYQTSSPRPLPEPIWRDVYYLRYETKNGLMIPVSIGMILRGEQQTWTLVSITKSPGFDIAKFDQEVAQ